MPHQHASQLDKTADTNIQLSASQATPAQPLSTDLNPANILNLQRQLGNRAVQRLIQRSGENGEPELNPAEAAAAIAWYQDQADTYTPSIIRQIQERLGRPATGEMTQADVQALAEWQANHLEHRRGASEPNGQADAYTLSALFPNGLASEEQAEAFVQDMRMLENNWEMLGNAHNRYQYLQTIIENRLLAVGVPMPSFPPVVISQGSAASAEFWSSDWSIHFYRPSPNNRSQRVSALDQDQPDPGELSWLIEQAYHEARHCEQAYQEARYLAGQGQSATQIETQMGIPAWVAEQAVREPLAGNTIQGVMAREWMESTVGSGQSQTNATYAELHNAYADQTQLREQFRENPSDENMEARVQGYARLRGAQGEYESLPEESDAYRTGQMAASTYDLDDLADAP